MFKSCLKTTALNCVCPEFEKGISNHGYSIKSPDSLQVAPPLIAPLPRLPDSLPPHALVSSAQTPPKRVPLPSQDRLVPLDGDDC